MSDEITVKKENVLRAYNSIDILGTGDNLRAVFVRLFPEVFEEEEKPESELYGLLNSFLCYEDAFTNPGRIMNVKRKIIDLAKKKVDECEYIKNYLISSIHVHNKLEEM